MEQVDSMTSVEIIRLIDETIDEAMRNAEVQNSLSLVTGDDSESYDAVAESLRQGVRSVLRTQFTSSNSEEAASYAAAIREALDQLRSYVDTFPEYQAISSLLGELYEQNAEKKEFLTELDKKRILARAREAASGELQRPSRTLFRRKVYSQTESGQLAYQYQSVQEELQQVRRKIADVASEQRRFELRIWRTEPHYEDQSQKVESAARTLHALVLEASLSSLRASIQEYAELRNVDNESTRVEAELTSDPDSTLSDSNFNNDEGGNDLTSQLQEASVAKSIGAIGPGDKRSVFLVHGRDTRAAKEMRIFLRALNLRIIEWENAVLETGQAAPYIGDVIFAGMRVADAVVVLSTPDDLVRLRPDLLSTDDPAREREISGQARANVIYEAGIADALDSSRTVLVEFGGVKSLSDLSGRNVVRFDGGFRSRQKLVNRLKSAGLAPDTTGDDWVESGDFDAAIEAARMALVAAT